MFSKLLFFIGVVCLGIYGFFTFEAHVRQRALAEELDAAPIFRTSSTATVAKTIHEGDLFGRLEIPSLDMSVMVMEGDSDGVLRSGGGRIPGAPLAIAGHRDSFFRPLKDIKVNDTIRLTTPAGPTEYVVRATRIVKPTDTWVLDQQQPDTLMLVTCYPFYYVGPAPDRFIVQADRK